MAFDKTGMMGESNRRGWNQTQILVTALSNSVQQAAKGNQRACDTTETSANTELMTAGKI